MSGDGVLAGLNWTGDSVGFEIDPLTLRQPLVARLRTEQQSVFHERYKQITANDE
jgi:hypothetical protein